MHKLINYNQFRINWSVCHKKFTRVAGRLKRKNFIRRIESKMKEFDTNVVESLLEGLRTKVRSIGDNGI